MVVPSSRRPKRKRGRPPPSKLPCYSNSQVNVESSPISQVQASPMTLLQNQNNDKQTIQPVTDHVGLQLPASIVASSIHKPIGLPTYVKVENHALDGDYYPTKDVNILLHQGVDKNFANGAAADTLEEETQPLTNIIDSSMYDVHSSYAETLQSIFEKHGNIVEDCTIMSPTIRRSFLEAICKGVQELQAKKLSEIDHCLLNSYYLVVNDCETMKLKVKWFAERLDEIRAAIDSLSGYQKIAEKMKQLEDEQNDLLLRRVELKALIFQVKAAEKLLESEKLQVVEEMNRSSRDLDSKFKHFEEMHLMHGVL